ncbi:retinoblastoma-like protein 2 isoform x2 [Limosa lapponica baueri]|uniref:Retinoblastoma-like protein 2 isoform x2 n=1 Tax=Limosa lapponica baueri TaxID=1758121 RepID=A0A2I0T317_LIMLA|nr:retinoblastoma-like protein 2 isoform x2 [Limosa lapponica baueri]
MCVCEPTGLSSSPTTLYDRYSSPTANPTRRRLFVDNDNGSDSGTPVRVSQQPVVNTVPVQNVNPEAMSVTPVPGQTLVTVATATVTANNGQTVTIPVQGHKDVLTASIYLIKLSRDSSPVMRSSSTLPVPHPGSAPPTPTRLTGANSDTEEEERGDLIQFYNNIYIEQIKEFALKYTSNAMDSPPLSPYPFVRIGSPRRVQLSQNHPVYISPHKNEATLSPREKIFYYFSSSPSKLLFVRIHMRDRGGAAKVPFAFRSQRGDLGWELLEEENVKNNHLLLPTSWG